MRSTTASYKNNRKTGKKIFIIAALKIMKDNSSKNFMQIENLKSKKSAKIFNSAL